MYYLVGVVVSVSDCGFDSQSLHVKTDIQAKPVELVADPKSGEKANAKKTQ